MRLLADNAGTPGMIVPTLHLARSVIVVTVEDTRHIRQSRTKMYNAQM